MTIAKPMEKPETRDTIYINRHAAHLSGEAFDTLAFQQLDEEAAYKAMAADTEREKEAREWCAAYFGPVSNQ